VNRVLAVVACAAAVLGFGVAVPVPAWADTTPPAISALRLLEAPVIGHAVQLRLSASDPVESGSGIVAESVTYENRGTDGGVVGRLTVDMGIGDIETSHVLGRWTAAGRWQATVATVSDYSGNQTSYDRDGRVSVGPGQTAPPAVDLASVDFTLTNASQDVAAPVVTGVAPVWTSRRPGDPMAVLVHVQDDRSQPADVSVTYRSPSGAYNGLSLTTPFLGPGSAGLASGVLRPGLEPGVWHADWIMVSDAAGNSLSYQRDRVPTTSPEGVRPFTTPPAIEWDQLDLTVLGGPPPDTAPPVLNSAALVTSATLQAGTFVQIGLAADDRSGVVSVHARYLDADGRPLDVSGFCRKQSKVGVMVPRGLTLGALTLDHLDLGDRLGNTVHYFPDGTTRDDKGVVGQHDLDLRALDLTLIDGQGPGAYPAEWRDCDDASGLTTTSPVSALRGSTVAVDGRLVLAGQPVADGVIALYRTDVGRLPRVVSLLQTDSDGIFHGSLRLDAPTAVRAEFLGNAQAPRALGPARTIRWKRGLSLTGASSVRTTTTSFTARIAPAEAGARLLLSRQVGRSWVVIAIGTTDARGVVTFRIPTRVGLQTYRAQSQLTARWAIATSPVVRQRRVT
jgi:hypothetical protein